jgi:hypothetical protein
VTSSRVPDTPEERLVLQGAADAPDTHADDEERRWGIHEAAERTRRANANRIPPAVSPAVLMMELEEKREAASKPSFNPSSKPSSKPRAALPRSRPGAIPLWMPRP